jgi:hypothetical protein
MWDVQGVLTPSLHAISPLLIISKRPVKVSSNHNIRWWFLYPIKDHSRTPSGKGCCDVEPPRGGHDRMATQLRNLGLGFVLFVYAMWRLMFVYFLAINGLLCFRVLACILFISCHPKAFIHCWHYLWEHTLQNFRLCWGLVAYLMNFSQGDTIRATKKQSDSNSYVKCATVQFHGNNHNSQSNY